MNLKILSRNQIVVAVLVVRVYAAAAAAHMQSQLRQTNYRRASSLIAVAPRTHIFYRIDISVQKKYFICIGVVIKFRCVHFYLFMFCMSECLQRAKKNRNPETPTAHRLRTILFYIFRKQKNKCHAWNRRVCSHLSCHFTNNLFFRLACLGCSQVPIFYGTSGGDKSVWQSRHCSPIRCKISRPESFLSNADRLLVMHYYVCQATEKPCTIKCSPLKNAIVFESNSSSHRICSFIKKNSRSK